MTKEFRGNSWEEIGSSHSYKITENGKEALFGRFLAAVINLCLDVVGLQVCIVGGREGGLTSLNGLLNKDIPCTQNRGQREGL